MERHTKAARTWGSRTALVPAHSTTRGGAQSPCCHPKPAASPTPLCEREYAVAVSKRLRYEILRRDDHTCRYCGKVAPAVELTVDHVVPTTLGGRDEPENLVAACRDCNAGKSSVPPGSPLVADVREDALRWARAMRLAAQIQHDDHAALATYVLGAQKLWLEIDGGRLPNEFDDTCIVFYRRDVSLDQLRYAIATALARQAVPWSAKWKYACGIIWHQVRERQEKALELIAEGAV